MHQFLKFIFGIKFCIFRTVPLSIISLLANCQQTCMTYTIAVCTVNTPDYGQSIFNSITVQQYATYSV